MSASGEKSAFDSGVAGEPVLLPPPPRAQKSVLKSLAALDAAEAAGVAPRPPVAPAVTIEGEAREIPADAARAKSFADAPRRSAAEPVQPLRANAFRPKAAASSGPQPRRSAWALRAAGVAVLLGAGWIGAAHMLPAISAASGQGEPTAKLSPMEQMQRDLQSAAAEIAALRERIAKLESPEARARQTAENETLKKSVFDLARRLEQARAAQTSAATELGARIERVRTEDARSREDMAERLTRLERQTSDGRPVASLQPLPQPLPPPPQGASTVVPRAAAVQPPPPADLEPRKPNPLAGYVLHEVQNGVALIESRRGFIEVYPGANVPGLGRVQSIVRRAGQWVVVTSNGVISK